MSNSSNTSASQTLNCNDDLVKTMFSGIDKIETPVYFIVGIFSRLISLAAIHRESKTEKAYFYQIYVLSAETVEILFCFLFQMARSLSNPFRINALWFQQCYACMWWTTHLSSFLLAASKTNTNLLTLTMALDRACAVWRPTKYAHLPHAIIRKVVPFATVIISVLIVLFSLFLFGMIDGPDGTYVQIVIFPQYGFVYTFFSELSAVFDVVVLLANISANIILCLGFRKAMKARAALRNEENTNEQWKTLFKMTFCQSFCNTLASFSEIGFLSISWFVTPENPTLYYTFLCLAAPLNSAFVELMDIVEFCLIMAVIKQFRSMVIGTMKRMFWCEANQQNRVIEIRASA